MAETTLIAETFSFNDRATGAGAGRAARGERGARREGKLDFANFETEPSDRPDRQTDRPAGERRADRDRNSDYACEEEIPTARGSGGEDEYVTR